MNNEIIPNKKLAIRYRNWAIGLLLVTSLIALVLYGSGSIVLIVYPFFAPLPLGAAIFCSLASVANKHSIVGWILVCLSVALMIVDILGIQAVGRISWI